ncbi:MAG TPA: S4 domain-containing protein [Nitrococcus sp.]|nr:S4 domain-containing protein [Nitrococcus sp.]
MSEADGESARLDRWLWAARFFKTRRLAADAIKGGKVSVNGVRAKPAKVLRAGSEVRLTKGPYEFVVIVQGLTEQRGPAVEAQKLYQELESSIERRAHIAEQRRIAATAMPQPDHRPDKRDRRRLAEFKRKQGA